MAAPPPLEPVPLRYFSHMFDRLRRLLMDSRERFDDDDERRDEANRESDRLKAQADAARYGGAASIRSDGNTGNHGF